MPNIFRFSLFGNFEGFTTNNTDTYLNLIRFFGARGYKPATANELQLQPNGQVRMLIMPTFLDDENGTVEITSNRINFQKSVNYEIEFEEFSRCYMNEYDNIIVSFLSEMNILSNRLALNVEIMKSNTSQDIPLQSDYFSDKVVSEYSLKNATRVLIDDEMCNVILEKYADANNNKVKFIYDINTLGETQQLRFEISNISKMMMAFINTAIAVEKGLK